MVLPRLTRQWLLSQRLSSRWVLRRLVLPLPLPLALPLVRSRQRQRSERPSWSCQRQAQRLVA
jgi:hypothetical protein